MKEFLLLALPVAIFILIIAIYGLLKGYEKKIEELEKDIEELEKDIEDKLKTTNNMSWALKEDVFKLERGHNKLVSLVDYIKFQQDAHNERIRKLEQ